jgi:lariat debranching enzyme
MMFSNSLRYEPHDWSRSIQFNPSFIQLSPPDIFISHDWPQGIEHHGNLSGLLSSKPFFRADIEKGELGSPPLLELMKTLRPKHWFSAHLHVKYEATYRHDELSSGPSGPVEVNPDEIKIDEDFEDPLPESAPSSSPVKPHGASQTRFLALDKCLPRRQYLEVLDIDTPIQSESPVSPSQRASSAEPRDPSPDLASMDLPTSFGRPTKQAPLPSTSSKNMPILTFDREWLAITRALHPYLSTQMAEIAPPNGAKLEQLQGEARQWLDERVLKFDDLEAQKLKIEDTQQFVMTAQSVTGPNAGGRGQPRMPC